MLSEYRKSINAILYERVTSPLYGTLIISWLIWNWKIIYLTFFVSEDKFWGSKIDFIVKNYSNPWDLYWLPLISTVLLILVVPLFSNGAYWINLKYQIWKYDLKNELEKKQLLTFEQSLALRKEIKEKEDEFGVLLQTKESEIVAIKTINLELTNKLKFIEDASKSKILNANPTNKSEYQMFKTNKKAFDWFGRLCESIKSGNLPEKIDNQVKEFYLLNDIVAKSTSGPNYKTIYYFTEKGKKFYKEYFNEIFRENELNKI